MANRRFFALILASYALAAFGAWAGKSIANAAPFALAAFVTGPGWIVLSGIALHSSGRRALWMLPGFPFALRGTGLFLLLVLNGLIR
ncbi:MAG TPA: hypothetical protein VHC72_14275 [Bryobacteraceae bacterium]|nr:hypothetical protein [Bryobacteraceae bacterium]